MQFLEALSTPVGTPPLYGSGLGGGGGGLDWTPGTYIFQNKGNDTTYVAHYNASYLAIKVRHCACRTRTPEQSAYRLQFLDALFIPVGTAPLYGSGHGGDGGLVTRDNIFQNKDTDNPGE